MHEGLVGCGVAMVKLYLRKENTSEQCASLVVWQYHVVGQRWLMRRLVYLREAGNDGREPVFKL